MATINFDRDRFLQSIRDYKRQKREWQERINKQLDKKKKKSARLKRRAIINLPNSNKMK